MPPGFVIITHFDLCRIEFLVPQLPSQTVQSLQLSLGKPGKASEWSPHPHLYVVLGALKKSHQIEPRGLSVCRAGQDSPGEGWRGFPFV